MIGTLRLVSPMAFVTMWPGGLPLPEHPDELASLLRQVNRRIGVLAPHTVDLHWAGRPMVSGVE